MLHEEIQNIHILFPKSQLQKLKQEAQAQRVSVAELIRKAVGQVYGTGVSSQKKLQAWQRLKNRNELEMEDWQQVKIDLLKRYE